MMKENANIWEYNVDINASNDQNLPAGKSSNCLSQRNVFPFQAF